MNVTVDPTRQLDTLVGGVIRARRKITVSLAEANRTTGTHVSEIQFQDPADQRPLATATVTWTLNGLLRSAPQQIHFGMVDRASRPVEKLVFVTLDQRGPFEFTKIESGSEHVSVQAGEMVLDQSQSQCRRIVKMTLKPSKTMADAVVSGSARLRTDALPGQEVVIPWSYFLKDF